MGSIKSSKYPSLTRIQYSQLFNCLEENRKLKAENEALKKQLDKSC